MYTISVPCHISKANRERWLHQLNEMNKINQTKYAHTEWFKDDLMFLCVHVWR